MMRNLYFLLPGTTKKFGGGGLWAEMKTVNLARQICPVQIVTYRQREDNYPFLTEVLKKPHLEDSIFCVSWGFDVPKLVAKLQDYNLIYHAHSANYGFNLPANIPILTVSRNTMGYWGQKSPNSLIYYLPNQIGEEFCNLQKTRDIDVLVQVRKSSEYLLSQLVPALKSRCRLQLLEGFVEDLAGLFNGSKVYLYDSAEYWATNGVTEGFGLPPLEALACGCQVFSSVNSALADYLDPGFNCHKIAGYSLEYDLQRILAVVNSSQTQELPASFWSMYRSETLVKRLEVILTEINHFFDSNKTKQTIIRGLSKRRLQKLWLQQKLAKLLK